MMYKIMKESFEKSQSVKQKSEFYVAKETKYGPILRRVGAEADNDTVYESEVVETPQESLTEEIELAEEDFVEMQRRQEVVDARMTSSQELKKEQREQLRAMLMALGFALMPMKSVKDVSEAAIEPVTNVPYEQFDESYVDTSFGREIEARGEKISEALLDKIDLFAKKPVRGAEDYTREEYVSEAIEFADHVPAAIQDELRKVLPGLCAQESRFDASSVSKVGAKAIFQFTDEVWAQYGGKVGEEVSLKKQVEIAGKFFSDLHKIILGNIQKEHGEWGIDVLRSKFHSEEDFQRNLVVLLMINAYNTGGGRMSEAVNEYLHTVDPEDMPDGHDLYVAIADFAYDSKKGKLGGYGPDSRGYVAGVYAHATKMQNRKKEIERG